MFRRNLEIDLLDSDQTIATPEEVPPNAITAARALFVKLTNPQAQPMLVFDQVLANLETKLLQQYKLLRGALIQIVKRDWRASLKINLCTVISIYNTIYEKHMTQVLIDTTEQGILLKTPTSPVIHSEYNNLMMRSLQALHLTEGAHLASVDRLLTRIVGFTGELDQELKKLTGQQVKDMIRNKPEIMPPEQAQDLARNPTLQIQLTVFLPLLSQFQQQSLNPYAPLNPICDQLAQQQIQ
ncbi:MAG: hypothetical protein EZS28_025186 [Streblomastix strix]|uniref:Uncharacterized protein n=1 Tax=Streblomastix strix TaxID=222440 RepID=A0A5J4VAC4_9EUKA|nr:MAG: hypothetical protein EZS28_025186 [Streblomastix strix]